MKYQSISSGNFQIYLLYIIYIMHMVYVFVLLKML